MAPVSSTVSRSTNPAELLEGSTQLPIGRAKGYGLSFMTDVLTGVMMGAKFGMSVFQDDTHFDVAHVMIAGLRGLGLPAAYVSGYLRTIKRSDPTRLAGADAMHAWVQVWCGSKAGWYGLDPTNALLAGEDHVVLALGRDYADVAPVDGVVFAAGAQRLSVTVSVTPLG